jgi:hypothetical protein
MDSRRYAKFLSENPAAMHADARHTMICKHSDKPDASMAMVDTVIANQN